MTRRSDLLYKDLSYEIIGAAMEVHRQLGHGFLEAVYEEALAYEFDLRGIPFERQKKLTVYYKGKVVGDYRADFVVDGKIIVELKALLTGIGDIEVAQAVNYLKATGLHLCLIVNFGEPSLRHRRVVLGE